MQRFGTKPPYALRDVDGTKADLVEGVDGWEHMFLN